MKKRIPILIFGGLFSALVQSRSADPDAAYFHPSASMYIYGDAVGASNLVARGLSVFPEDKKLLRLQELLEKEREKQKQNDQQQQDKNKEQEQNKERQLDQQQQEPPHAGQMSRDEAEQLLDAMQQEEENKRLQLRPVMGVPVQVDKNW